MGEGLNKPVFSQRCLQTFFIFLSPAPRSFSHALFARELADVFEKNEKKNKTTFVYRLILKSLDNIIIFNTFAHELLPVDAVWSRQSFIYEELTDIFEENKHGFDSKSRTLTHFAAFEERMANKWLAKPSRSLLQLAILGVCMRRIKYDSATVNNSVFIEQRNISFQNDISLKKPWDWGVSSWKKLKHRETHGRIVSLEQTGSRKAIADLFVMFIAWTSQKASKVHKLPSQRWP